MGKLEKFEGEHESGKEPVEVIDDVGDSLTPALIEIDRLITDDIVRTYFPAFTSLAALKAANPHPLSHDILAHGTLVEIEIKAASRGNRNTRDRRKNAEQRRILMQIREDLRASANALTENRETDAQECLSRASRMQLKYWEPHALRGLWWTNRVQGDGLKELQALNAQRKTAGAVQVAFWQEKADAIWERNSTLPKREVAIRIAERYGGNFNTIRRKIRRPANRRSDKHRGWNCHRL